MFGPPIGGVRSFGALAQYLAVVLTGLMAGEISGRLIAQTEAALGRYSEIC